MTRQRDSRRRSATARRSGGLCSCCRTNSCSEGKCSIRLPPSTEVTCWNGSSYQATHSIEGKLCDCLLLWKQSDAFRAVVIELKGGRLNARSCIQQLQGGATLLEKTSDGEASFLAVLAVNRLHPLERRILEKERVIFRSQKYLVQLARCGASLQDFWTN